MISSRLLLIGASGLATQPPPLTAMPNEYSSLCTAGARSCRALVSAAVPAGALADGVASVRAAGIFELRFDRAWRTLELTLQPEQP